SGRCGRLLSANRNTKAPSTPSVSKISSTSRKSAAWSASSRVYSASSWTGVPVRSSYSIISMARAPRSPAPRSAPEPKPGCDAMPVRARLGEPDPDRAEQARGVLQDGQPGVGHGEETLDRQSDERPQPGVGPHPGHGAPVTTQHYRV